VIDSSVFRQAIPAEVTAHHAEVAAWYEGRPNAWEFPAHVVRAARDAGESIFGLPVHSPRAVVREVLSKVGSIPIRIVAPDTEPRGVYLHIHGGGWVLGAAAHHDDLSTAMADACSVVVVSVDYRLAPEHPYPAGADDCESVAVWLTAQAQQEFGSNRLLIGGESAGANLAAVTLLRMRDRHDYTKFACANLVYGAYDLTDTPSVRGVGDGSLILNGPIIKWFQDQYVPAELRSNPDVSPLYARLHDMPPAIFTVGTLDPLLDDSLFMASRWTAAGNIARTEVVPGAIHAFDYFPTDQAERARTAMHDFLNKHLHPS